MLRISSVSPVYYLKTWNLIASLSDLETPSPELWMTNFHRRA